MSSGLHKVGRVTECIIAGAAYTVGGIFAAVIDVMFLAKGDPDGLMRVVLILGVILSPVIFLVIAPLYYYSKAFRTLLVSLAIAHMVVFAGVLIYGYLTK